MKNPAREKFLPMLSPYVDGELTPEERQLVEQHLANNKESAMQVADFRAGDAIMRHALEMQADEVDWKGFTDDVMSKVTPDKLPLFERLKLSFSEMFTYQRGPLVAGFVGAAAAVAIMVPVTLKLAAGTPHGYGAEQVRVQTVSVQEDSTVKPVVIETEGGDAIIWVMDGDQQPDGGKKKKKDGEHNEETLTDDPENQGEL
ncbi:MAG: zf-HC2 domain-containing protein [Myxococcaceae bacterium]